MEKNLKSNLYLKNKSSWDSNWNRKLSKILDHVDSNQNIIDSGILYRNLILRETNYQYLIHNWFNRIGSKMNKENQHYLIHVFDFFVVLFLFSSLAIGGFNLIYQTSLTNFVLLFFSLALCLFFLWIETFLVAFLKGKSSKYHSFYVATNKNVNIYSFVNNNEIFVYSIDWCYLTDFHDKNQSFDMHSISMDFVVENLLKKNISRHFINFMRIMV